MFVRVFIAVLAGCLFFGCFQKETQSTGLFGHYRSTGREFVEEIAIIAGPEPVYEHTVVIGGKVMCHESGKARVKGPEVELEGFTQWIDAAAGLPLPAPKAFIYSSVYFFEAPPFDMLKPDPESEYFLRKK